VEGNLINKNLSQRVETINAGFSANGPSGYYLYLKNWGMDLDPDVVVVGFYMGNDITGRRDIEWIAVDSNGLPDVIRSTTSFVGASGELRSRKLPIQYSYPILRESHLFIFLFTRLLPDIRVPSPMARFIHDVIRRGNQANTVQGAQTPLICQFTNGCTAMDVQKEEIKKLFLGMNKIVESRGKKFLVLLMPAEFQIWPEKSIKYGFYPPFSETDVHIPNDEFSAFFAKNGIDYLDLLPVFEKRKDVQAYYEQDDHWNPTGHEIAAQAISEKLMEYVK
jgi:hypothetical protein